MGAPLAEGVRTEWGALPEWLRTGVERRLGSPVQTATTQRGGFSPGVAARLRCADGRRAFVKAAHVQTNETAVRMHLQEAVNTAALPPAAPVPRLRHVLDERGWVVLIFDEVPGAMPPTPWRAADVADVRAALIDLAAALTPSPVPHAPPARDSLGPDLERFAALVADPPPAFDQWTLRHLDRLADLAAASPSYLDGDTLVHMDIRADNLLITPDRRVFVVDWPHAARGAAWLDSMALGLNVALYGGDPEAVLRDHPLLTGVDSHAVDAVLVGLIGYFLDEARQPAMPGLPTVRAFQQAQGEVLLPWVRRRMGWD